MTEVASDKKRSLRGSVKKLTKTLSRTSVSFQDLLPHHENGADRDSTSIRDSMKRFGTKVSSTFENLEHLLHTPHRTGENVASNEVPEEKSRSNVKRRSSVKTKWNRWAKVMAPSYENLEDVENAPGVAASKIATSSASSSSTTNIADKWSRWEKALSTGRMSIRGTSSRRSFTKGSARDNGECSPTAVGDATSDCEKVWDNENVEDETIQRPFFFTTDTREGGRKAAPTRCNKTLEPIDVASEVPSPGLPKKVKSWSERKAEVQENQKESLRNVRSVEERRKDSPEDKIIWNVELRNGRKVFII